MLRRGTQVMLTVLLTALGAACGEAPTTSPPIPAFVEISGAPAWVQAGRSVQLTARLVDEHGNTAGAGGITWLSDRPAVALVSGTGLVTTRTPGEAEIRAVHSATLANVTGFQVVDSLVTNRLFLDGAPYQLALAGGSAYVTLLERDSLAVVSLDGGSLTGWAPLSAEALAIAINPTRTRAYVLHRDVAIHGALGIVALVDNTLLATIPIPHNPIALLVSPDGNTIWVTASTSVDEVIYVVDAATRTIVDSASAPFYGAHLLHHPTLPRLYLSGTTSFSGEPNLAELDAVTLDTLRTWALGGNTQGMAISEDGARLYVTNEDGWIDALDLSGGLGDLRSILPRFAHGVALSPDGTTLAIAVGAPYAGGSPAGVWELATATLTTTRVITTGGKAIHVAYLPGGSRLVVANQAGWVDYIR